MRDAEKKEIMKIKTGCKSNQIEWADYFKAIAILLVVIGHSTGQFNQYIYQFHVGAFFFISGFLSKVQSKQVDEIIIKKGYSLLVPYIFFGVLGLLLFAGLQQLGVLQYVSVHAHIPPLVDNIKTIFTALYCDWLGATWFLTSLFGVYVLCKITAVLDHDRTGLVFCLVSIIMFAYGYFTKQAGIELRVLGINLQHYLLIQIYFALGMIVRAFLLPFIDKLRSPFYLLILVISIVGFYLINTHWKTTMDLVSNSVNTPLKDFLMVVNGILFILSLSKLLQSVGISRINKVLCFIGNNTMGILFFHFFGYKITTAILYLFGICTTDAFSQLVPPAEVSCNWWPLYVFVSVSFSLVIWRLIQKSKILRIITGQERDIINMLFYKYQSHVR